MAKVDEQTYKELLGKEAKYWDKVSHDMLNAGQFPDLQIPFRKQGAQALWDDSEVNFFVRGKYLQKLLNICCYKSGIECLELCCGIGALTLEAARRDANVTGIDIASKAIQIGKNYQAKIQKQPNLGKVDLVVSDLNTIKLPEKKYNAVFVWDGLHHIIKIDHLVSEVVKTLKDDGVFVVHDHVSIPKWRRKLAMAISGLLLLILPTEKKFSTKIKEIWIIILRRKKSAQYEKVLTSPFEDVSGENIIKSIRIKFKIVELHRYLSLSHYIAAKIRLDCKWRFGLIRFITVLDTFLTFFRILKPEYFFLVAHKNTKGDEKCH